jgi:SAM-dependent methyltransferase
MMKAGRLVGRRWPPDRLPAIRRVARRIGGARASGDDWHRRAVGGMWEELGKLQFEFLVGEGLSPEHLLLDIGCGSLRGGVHFIRYLEPGHYVGVEQSPELLAAGRSELERAGIIGKRPTLVADATFSFGELDQSFDFALAQSVFTHLTFNAILRCVAEAGRVLRPDGRFFATFFASPGPRLRVEPAVIDGSNVYLDRDPYYYDPAVFSWMCDGSDLECEHRKEWGHPSSHMLVFTKRSVPAS